MFKVNRKIEYALIALRYINSKPKDLVSAKEICDVYKTPFDTTSRVLQIMAQNGIVKAEHGAYGGYQISKDLTKVTLLALVEMILGPMKIANCFSKSYSACELVGGCNIIAPMLNLNDKMIDLFKTISVHELIQARHQGDRAIKEKYNEKSEMDSVLHRN